MDLFKMESKFMIFFLYVFVTKLTVVDSPSQSTATCGAPGIPGIPGVPGNPGRDGTTGSRGPAGEKGKPGERSNDYVDLMRSNWKQCVWKRSDGKDSGLIQNCIFNKKYDNTSLRVFYEGTLGCEGARVCNRWYFTFDGAECTKPATIEGIVWVSSSTVITYRHRHIEGYCNQVPKGHIRVGFWIGKCESYSLGNASSGWLSMSRIVIEEVPPPQA